MNHFVRQALNNFRSVVSDPDNPTNDAVLGMSGVPLMTLALAKEMLRIYPEDWEVPAEQDLVWLLGVGFLPSEDAESNLWSLGPIKCDISKKTGTVTWWCGFYQLDHVKSRQDVRNLVESLRLNFLVEPEPSLT